LEKCPKQKFWIGRVWVVKELFYYNYPFCLPDFFQQKLTKDDFAVRIEVLKVFSSMEFEKKFFVREFLDSYHISNQRITNIKRYFIQLIKVLEEYDLIESNYKMISNKRLCRTIH